MRQENLNNKIKDLFGSMDDYDQKEALTRKEDVWQAVHPYKEKKKGRQWLLILLLCSLFFGAGWFLKYKNTTPAESPKIEQQDKILPTKTNQLPIAQMKMKLNFKEQQLDSLMEVNRILSAELTALDERREDVLGSVSTKRAYNLFPPWGALELALTPMSSYDLRAHKTQD